MKRPAILRHPGILVHWREYPEGSIERAKALGLEVMFTFQRVETTLHLWDTEKELVERERPWITLGLPSRDAFIEAITGHSEKDADSKVTKRDAIRERRRDHPDETQEETAAVLGCDQAWVSRVMTKKSTVDELVIIPNWLKSRTSKALFRKLSPTDQARVRQLEIPLRVAARAAGILPDLPTPLDQLRHWWRKADAVAQQTFWQEITSRKDGAA